MNARRVARAASLLSMAVASALVLGCAGQGTVERAYGGTVVEGRFITPDAYAAFLRGAIAEADGHVAEAMAAYAEAARRDPASPEPWARMADLGCRTPGQAERAREQIEHALKLDAGYAPAWEIDARCLLSRGRTAEAAAAAARAAALDPRADGANVLVSRLGGDASTASTREALLALTHTAPDREVAWEALAAWARAHGDVASWASALRELARLAPARRDALAASAEELAGLGETGPARSVAGAAVDASDAPLSRRSLAARLAVDDALAAGDEALVRRRATRARIGLEEVAARALLAGNVKLARTLSAQVSGADPGSLGARLVHAVCTSGDLGAAAASGPAGGARVSGAAYVVFGVMLARAAPPAAVRAVLASIAHEPLVPGDDRTLRPAVELASRGVLSPAELPPDGAVELAVLGGTLPPDAGPLDARHQLLALALTHPDAPGTRELSARLAPLSAHASRDPVIASAMALVQLATGAPLASDASRALLAINPADPLLAATALRLAEKSGDTDVARRARATLAALGGRPSRVE